MVPESMHEGRATATTVRSGIELLEETLGTGQEASRGAEVTIAYEMSLRRGDVVQTMPAYTFVLGARRVIAALEYGVEGMRVGGRRRFRVGSQLGYGPRGVDGIPPDAMLELDVELLSVTQPGGG